jgi:hypothetical protein
MAITRAQQYQQLVNKPANGKRPGYRGDPRDFGFNPAQAAANVGRASTASTGRADPTDVGFDAREAQRSKQYSGITPTDNKGRIIDKEKKPSILKTIKTKSKNFIDRINKNTRDRNTRFFRKSLDKKQKGYLDKFNLTEEQLNMLLEGDDEFKGGGNLTFTGLQQLLDMDPSARNLGENFNEALMKGKLGELEMSPGMKKGNKLTRGKLYATPDSTTRIELPNFAFSKLQGPENFSNFVSGLNRMEVLQKLIDKPGGVTSEDIENYRNLSQGKGGTDPLTGKTIDPLFYPRDEGSPEYMTDPCKGPNPPAYCFIGQNADDNMEAATVFQPNFRVLADGGMTEDAPVEGGIMDLESGRQMYFLGKLVKKATRAVKKIIKSPIGKAALAFGAYKLGSGFMNKQGLGGLLRGSLLGTSGPGPNIGTPGLLKKFGFIKSGYGDFGGLTGKGMFGLGSLFTLSPFLMGDQDDTNQEQMYAGADLPYPVDYYLSGNFPMNRRLVADGGIMRADYQEGGDVEPVAKKTMPLIDMDGKEKDYRETGGFVDMGRMERADDVPARLSKNEFVFTADAVRNAGEGDIDKGAEVMYNMMKNLEAGGEVSEESQGLEGARNMFQTSQRLEEVL